MILRNLAGSCRRPSQAGFLPAYKVFLDSQQRVSVPYGIVLQPEHARLAGDLAAQLEPDIFGEIPQEVIEAVRDHDLGWRSNDETHLAHDNPVPFPSVPPSEAVACWKESIRLATERSALRGALTSRHFCALAHSLPDHNNFLEQEQPHGEDLERELNLPAEQLHDWTAALGFCDLLSLILCAGVSERVALPLAHPALPESRSARKVILDWDEGNPRFSSRVMKPGAVVSIDVREKPDEEPGLQPLRLTWQLVG